MRDPHTKDAITDERQEAPFREMNIARMKDLTMANIMEPMTVIGMIVGGMCHTTTEAKITGKKIWIPLVRRT